MSSRIARDRKLGVRRAVGSNVDEHQFRHHRSDRVGDGPRVDLNGITTRQEKAKFKRPVGTRDPIEIKVRDPGMHAADEDADASGAFVGRYNSSAERSEGRIRRLSAQPTDTEKESEQGTHE